MTLAGIKKPPFHYTTEIEGSNEWLKHLASNRTPVSCTLLSRRRIDSKTVESKAATYDIPMDTDLEQTAICHVRYRPRERFFRQDLGCSLVRHGRAGVVTSGGIHIDVPHMPTIDGSKSLSDLEANVKYLETLANNEFNAVKEKKGIWSIESIRNERPDLVEEADFEMNAGILRKLWRRIIQ